ncbi:hypothetical protein ACOME3_004028 [Neoechinorhynchus agilis]
MHSLHRSWRLLIAILCCAGLTICFNQRTNLSISILCMINKTNGNESSSMANGPFSWSPTQIGNILSAYYYGYAIGQIPGGFLAAHYGSKSVALISIFGSSMLTIATPPAARTALSLILIDRVAIGVFAGLLWSTLFQVGAKWFPTSERTLLLSIVNSGSSIGVIISNPISAEFCLANGNWEWSFYLSGILGLLWCIVWIGFVRSTPGDHRFIKKEELDYIEETIKRVDKSTKIPVLKIMTNYHCLGFFTSHSLMAFSFHAFAVYIWILLKQKVTDNMRKLCYSVILYWFAFMVMTPIFGYLSDWLINRRSLLKTTTRRLCVCIGCVIPGLMMLILGFMSIENSWSVIAVFTVMYLTMSVVVRIQLN